MSEEEKLSLNSYIETLFQGFQFGDILFDAEHSMELYNLINKVLNENQELKKQLEIKHDGFMASVEDSCELAKENQELKKQLENCYCNRTDCSSRIKNSKKYDSLVQKVENQQKEFIKWLESEIKACELTCDLIFNHNKEMKIYKEILSKYKEIIGVKE